MIGPLHSSLTLFVFIMCCISSILYDLFYFTCFMWSSLFLMSLQHKYCFAQSYFYYLFIYSVFYFEIFNHKAVKKTKKHVWPSLDTWLCRGTLFLPYHPFSDLRTLTLGHKTQRPTTVFRMLESDCCCAGKWVIFGIFLFLLLSYHNLEALIKYGHLKNLIQLVGAIHCSVCHSQLRIAIYCLCGAWVKVFIEAVQLY